MSRLRAYPGDDGDAERDREAQWLSLTPTGIPVFQPGDDPLGSNRRRTGLIYVHLRYNCRTQRTHGFDRCNRHTTPMDHQRGYRYCIQCREHSDVTEQTAWDASGAECKALRCHGQTWFTNVVNAVETPSSLPPRTATAIVQHVWVQSLYQKLLWSMQNLPLNGYVGHSCSGQLGSII